MQIYESISILKSSLNDEEVQKIQSRLEGIIAKDGEMIAVENWGRKKLAYEVKKEKKGIFLLFRFRGSGKNISELERSCRLDDQIVKFMTVKLERKAAAQLEKTILQAGKAPQEAGGTSSV